MRGSQRILSKPQSLCADCTSCADCRHYMCLYAIDTNYREVEPVVIDEGDGVETVMWDTDLFYTKRVAR